MAQHLRSRRSRAWGWHVQCGQCGHANEGGGRFCAGCGAPLSPMACAACSGALPASARFCPACGVPVVAAPRTTIPRPSQVSPPPAAPSVTPAPSAPPPPATPPPRVTPPPSVTPPPPVTPPPSVTPPPPVTPPPSVTPPPPLSPPSLGSPSADLPPRDPTAEPPPVFFAVPASEPPRPADATARSRSSVDRTEALLASRDPDGTPYDHEEASPEDLQLYQLVQEDRERRRRRRRTVMAAAISFVVLVAGLAVARRAGERTPTDGTAPPATSAEGPASTQADSGASPTPRVSETTDGREQTARPLAQPERPEESPSTRTSTASPRGFEPTSETAAVKPREIAPPASAPRATPEVAARRGQERSRAQSTTGPPAAEESRTDRSRVAAAPAEPTPPARPPSALELPERDASGAASTRTRSEAAPAPRAPRSTPPAPTPSVSSPPVAIASPPSPAPPSPDVRVEVAQKVDRTNSAIDYTVRVSAPDGRPVTDADVRLRGVTTDGVLVEAPLEPAGAPGVYSGLIAFSSRGPRGLTVRVGRADRVVEVPVSAPALRTQ